VILYDFFPGLQCPLLPLADIGQPAGFGRHSLPSYLATGRLVDGLAKESSSGINENHGSNHHQCNPYGNASLAVLFEIGEAAAKFRKFSGD